jgi:formate dehydrogenase major subunit
VEVTRREFLRLSSAGVIGVSALGFDLAPARQVKLELRIEGATVSHTVCPYCAVGCALLAYTKKSSSGKVELLQIEGDPDSPISRGRLCPKGSASEQLVNNPGRQTTILYRAPHGTEWQSLGLDQAIEMVADRFIEARRNGWQDFDEHGRAVRRTMGIASLGGATLDNEENYLIKKLFTAAGAIQVENQARI